MREYLQLLRSMPEFQLLITELYDHRPVVPEYDYTDDNTQEWKALSNKRQGFDLALTLLGEEI